MKVKQLLDVIFVRATVCTCYPYKSSLEWKHVCLVATYRLAKYSYMQEINMACWNINFTELKYSALRAVRPYMFCKSIHLFECKFLEVQFQTVFHTKGSNTEMSVTVYSSLFSKIVINLTFLTLLLYKRL